jgi:hypothetical protein
MRPGGAVAKESAQSSVFRPDRLLWPTGNRSKIKNLGQVSIEKVHRLWRKLAPSGIFTKLATGFPTKTPLARFPSEWSRSLDKKSRKFKKLERVQFARTMPCERNAL